MLEAPVAFLNSQMHGRRRCESHDGVSESPSCSFPSASWRPSCPLRETLRSEQSRAKPAKVAKEQSTGAENGPVGDGNGVSGCQLLSFFSHAALASLMCAMPANGTW
jgi:hypothetical protein